MSSRREAWAARRILLQMHQRLVEGLRAQLLLSYRYVLYFAFASHVLVFWLCLQLHIIGIVLSEFSISVTTSKVR